MRHDRVDIVRRLTGGGAILHDKELTFCLVTALEDSIIPEQVPDSYNMICRAVINGLQILGIDAQIRGSENTGVTSAGAQAYLPRQKSSSIPTKTERDTLHSCNQPFFSFARPSKYDIVFNGKKLVGSAQRRRHGILLHHGSILIGEQNLDGSTSINSIIGRKVTMEELSKNIAIGFEKELSMDLVPCKLTEEELELSQQLAIAKKRGKFSVKAVIPAEAGI